MNSPTPHNLESIQTQAQQEISLVTTAAQLEQCRIKYLGRKGVLNELFQEVTNIPVKQRRTYGQQINNLKTSIGQLIETKQASLKQTSSTQIEDLSLPGIRLKLGHLHPTTQTIREINDFFKHYGFSVYTGPEIENNEYNFEKLNLPLAHPARDLADTLYIHEPHTLLRTHTSSVEARALMNEQLPLRIVVPGKVYRNETSNATNNSMFYQYEGLLIDENVSLADLKGLLIAFVQFLYGPQVRTRFRCKYYPQVEPGAGLDVGCTFCEGKGCGVCKYRGYIEVLGAGMVHPNMLRACDIDPEKWSGLAFGLGLDRLVMLKHDIQDIRKLYNGELVMQTTL